MKKLVSLILVLAMILSASVVTFATTADSKEDEIIITAEDSKGKNVKSKIEAEYLTSSDSVYKAIRKADDAEDFVESIGVEDEVDELISDYTIARNQFEFSASKNLNYPIDVTFKVSGVSKNDTVVVLLKSGSDWYVLEAEAGKDKVTASFDRFGKIVVLIGEAPDGIPNYRGYDDVFRTDWFYDAVRYCTDKGYLEGVSATSFGPEITLTRAMVAVTIYRIEGSPSHAIDYPFLDCPSSWYQEGIAWAYDNGVITGYSDRAFGPNDPVTREQLVAMIGRYEQYKGKTLKEGSVDVFSDAGSISRYAVPYVKWAVGQGLLNGRGLNGIVLLVPTGQATRAEFAQVLYNYMK